MKLEIKATFIVAILLFATSCTYNFSEDYFNEIQANDPNVNITLTGFTDGEETSSSKTVQYTITGVGNDEFEMIVKVDEVEIYRSQEKTGEFYLLVDNLVDGDHQLTVEYIFPTNSGSLSDSVGGEFFIGGVVYDFTVDKSLANSFGIASVNIVQGSIYITLDPITDDNFEEVYLLIQNEFGFVIEERPISQEDLTDLEIHDDQTVFYNPSYAIKVKNAFAEDTSDFVSLPTTKMKFTLEPLSYSSFKLIYNEHPLYGNFDSMAFEYTYRFSGLDFHSVNPQGGETIINYGYFFGETFSVNLKMYKNNSLIGNIFEQLQVGSSLPISGFEEITYISSIDKYFLIDITTVNELVIYQLNGQSFEVENSRTLATLDFSGDFKSLELDPISNALIINMNKRALIFNPVTFSIVSTHNAVSYNSNKASADVYYRGEFVILEDPWPSGEVLIYEIATGIQKFSINKTTNFFSAIDASFFYANGGLYKFQAGNFVFVNAIQDSQNNRNAPALVHMTFDKLSNSAVFGWYRNTYFLNLENNTQNYIWDPDDVYDVKYTDDGRPFINSSHFSAGTRSHIYDVNINKTRIIDTFGQQSFRYFNGVIFSPNGFYLESNLYTN